MSSSVLETSVNALIAALNTSRPTGVPVVERDRWVDVDTLTESALLVAGYEDDPQEGQDADRVLDRRRANVNFECYAVGDPLTSTTASAELDVMVQWIAKKCGVVSSTHPLASTGAYRVTFEKRLLVVGKGGACRCLVVLGLEYQNLTNDVTRSK